MKGIISPTADLCAVIICVLDSCILINKMFMHRTCNFIIRRTYGKIECAGLNMCVRAGKSMFNQIRYEHPDQLEALKKLILKAFPIS